eukprot:124381-Prymnesium_polylepis.1
MRWERSANVFRAGEWLATAICVHGHKRARASSAPPALAATGSSSGSRQGTRSARSRPYSTRVAHQTKPDSAKSPPRNPAPPSTAVSRASSSRSPAGRCMCEWPWWPTHGANFAPQNDHLTIDARELRVRVVDPIPPKELSHRERQGRLLAVGASGCRGVEEVHIVQVAVEILVVGDGHVDPRCRLLVALALTHHSTRVVAQDRVEVAHDENHARSEHGAVKRQHFLIELEMTHRTQANLAQPLPVGERVGAKGGDDFVRDLLPRLPSIRRLQDGALVADGPRDVLLHACGGAHGLRHCANATNTRPRQL